MRLHLILASAFTVFCCFAAEANGPSATKVHELTANESGTQFILGARGSHLLGLSSEFKVIKNRSVTSNIGADGTPSYNNKIAYPSYIKNDVCHLWSLEGTTLDNMLESGDVYTLTKVKESASGILELTLFKLGGAYHTFVECNLNGEASVADLEAALEGVFKITP